MYLFKSCDTPPSREILRSSPALALYPRFTLNSCCASRNTYKSGKLNLDANAVVIAQFGSVNVETTKELRWPRSYIRRKCNVIYKGSVQSSIAEVSRCWHSPPGKCSFALLINRASPAGFPPRWNLHIEVPKQDRSLPEGSSHQDFVAQDIQIFAGALPTVL